MSENLDQEEQELLRAFEAEEFESILTDERKAHLAKLAGQTFKKEKRINARLSVRDFEAFQRRALEEGIPYQTLISSVLHKYVSGGFQEISGRKPQRV